jgi:hypothetical protein
MWAEATANTEDAYIEITVPTGVSIRVIRVASNGSNGLNTSSRDIPIKLLMKITSTASSGTDYGALTIVKKNPYGPASGVTVNGKINNGHGGTPPGTLDTLLDQINYLPFMNFEWVDLKGGGYIVDPGKYFVVSLAENSASGNSRIVSITWEEI